MPAGILDIKTLGTIEFRDPLNPASLLSAESGQENQFYDIDRSGRIVGMNLVLDGAADRGQLWVRITVFPGESLTLMPKWELYNGYAYEDFLPQGWGSLPVQAGDAILIRTYNSSTGQSMRVRLLIADEDGSPISWNVARDPHTNGWLHVETIVTDAHGDDSTTFTPAQQNTRRILYGFAWYYNASADAATRILHWSLRRPWGALPTGFAAAGASDVIAFDGPSLTASQEGTEFAYAGPGGPSSHWGNANGSLTPVNVATNPVGFPLEVQKDDPLTLILAPTNGHDNDRYSVYALEEDWVVPG
jgi:hypothetical protein